MEAEMMVKVRQFLTKSNPSYPDRKPVPMRVMFGYVKQESARGVYVVLRGKATPTSYCFVCGRELTHPVSLKYGIGPECGGHFHQSPMPKADLDAWYESLKAIMPSIIWEGWLPKSAIEIEATGEMIEAFGLVVAPVVEPKVYATEAPIIEVVVDAALVDALAKELSL